MKSIIALSGAALALGCSATSSLAQTAPPSSPPATATPPAAAPAPGKPAEVEIPEVKVTAERLNQARNGLSPRTGSSTYRFDEKDIANLPAGDATDFNQVLLQAPGVTNDSYGQLHVRGDHSNLQYRINGVILPEGITGFGQALDARFARRIELVTGALPAQYGYRTAGVVEIETKDGYDPGGRLNLTLGSRGTVNPSFELQGNKGDWSYYVTGNWLQNNLGIESPTSAANPIHDRSTQSKAFGYFSYLIDPDTKLNVILGNSEGRFQIPNNPNQAPNTDFLTAAGVANFSSSNLNENQREINRYGVIALQGSPNAHFDYQIAAYARKSSVRFDPDPVGDLVFTGVASQVYRSSFTTGVQGDASWKLNDTHTIRMGFSVSNEDDRADNTSTVFPVDATGTPTGGPLTIVDNNAKNGNRLYGLYLQDEWRITPKLTLNYGARADLMQAYVNAGQISPRVGMVYKLDEKTSFHAAYARYFTPPPNELVSQATIAAFQGTSLAPQTNQNSQVQPERTHYFDVGVVHQLTPAISLGLDSYYKVVRNLLDEGQFGSALIYTPFNYARAKVYGVELTAAYKEGNFSSYANFAVSRARASEINSAEFNFDPAELAYIASNYIYIDHDQRITASGGASYLWHNTRFSVDGYYGSGLRRGFANTEKLPAYSHVNFGVTQRLNTADLGKVDLRLNVVNVFNKAYELRDGTGVGVGAPQWGPRRGFFATISKIF